MPFTRRAVLKLGMAGFLAQTGYATASCGEQSSMQDRSFDRWRRDFEANLPKRMEATQVVGASVAITAKGDAVGYAASFGFANLGTQRKLTAETPMHFASISKLFTATALVQLFERRGYDLHANVNDFIHFSVKNPHHPDIPITPHQLVTHTSSISDEGYGDIAFPGDPTQSLSDFLRDYLVEGGSTYAAATSFLTEKPGAKWDYSNVGASLAGYIIECASDQPFASYIDENIFQPLGIDNAHWYIRDFMPDVLATPYTYDEGKFIELPQQGYPDVPAGMLRCSVSNLVRALNAMIGQETGDKMILSPAAVQEMLRPQVDSKTYPYQGVGWTDEEAGRKVVGHTGSDRGASNMIALTEDHNQAVALLMNIDGTEQTSKFRASIIDDLLIGATLL